MSRALAIKAHPRLQGLRRWMLATADAHELYAQYGFSVVARLERLMEIVDMEIYQRPSSTAGDDKVHA